MAAARRLSCRFLSVLFLVLGAVGISGITQATATCPGARHPFTVTGVVAAATALAVTETPPSGEYVWVEAVSGTFALTPAGKTVGLGTLYFTGLQGTTPQLWTQTSLTQSASASDRYLEGLRGSTAGGAVSFVSVANTNTPAVAGMMTGFTSTSDTFPPAGICPLDVSGTSSGGTVEVAQISGGALTTIQTVWSGMAVGFSLVAFFLAALFFVSLRRR